MARPSQDPRVIKCMEVLLNWNMKIGFNDGRGLYYIRPTVQHIEQMAKEMLKELSMEYDPRA